ncbi:peptidase S28 [Thelephora terrestris]|uniref:Peptidase S28 n=1 Tax=Thelephora terrestris TaxID=56493 RepID=A0A9P6HHX8_9AGAM|nr:peptidase S28 [Thelephora terrestris]
MLSSLKAALALVCLFALTVDALRSRRMENFMKGRGQTSHRKRDLPNVKRDVPTQWATLPIDHWGNEGTFQNRYWYNATYYQQGGPVFLYDVGETNAEPFTAFLDDGESFHSAVMRLAKRYHGVAIVWEHRYYGESLPFPINNETTKEQWQFHTVEQALEDVIYFAQRFSFPHPDSRTASYRPYPSTTPWIFIGGSYPGIRAAFLRIRNPETIFASWASSAPVEAQIDMSSYWQAAERALPRNCSNDWVAVTKYFDEVFTNGSDQEIFDLKARIVAAEFTGPGGNTSLLKELDYPQVVDQFEVLDLAVYLMDPLGDFQDNGLPPVQTFCNILETVNGTRPAYSEGLTARFNITVALDAFLIGISETNPETFATTQSSDVEDADSLAWEYEFCSEFGFFMGANPHNNRSIQSQFESLAVFQQQCLDAFPEGAVPPEPRVQVLDDKYGGWFMNPTHVFFTNGEIDPWRTLSVASFEENAPKRIGSLNIPACYTAPDPSSYFGIVYPGKTHAKDLASSFAEPEEAFYTSLALFQMALDEWLPCFLSKD